MIMYDPVWSIYEGAIGAVLKAIGAGPAEDAARAGLPLQVVHNVAVISLDGPLMRRETWFGAGYDETRTSLRAAISDDTISDILLRIDSPGGTVAGLDQLASEIAASPKPVTAAVDGMAASAAYWLASQANQIVASRSDLIGSIGVRMMLYDFSKAFEAEGIKAIPVDTGTHKSAGAMGTEITDEQVAEFQRVIDQHYDMFIDAIAQGRGMTRSAAKELGDGRIWTGEESLKLGLIDAIATPEEILGSLVDTRPSTDSRRARLDKFC